MGYLSPTANTAITTRPLRAKRIWKKQDAPKPKSVIWKKKQDARQTKEHGSRVRANIVAPAAS